MMYDTYYNKACSGDSQHSDATSCTTELSDDEVEPQSPQEPNRRSTVVFERQGSFCFNLLERSDTLEELRKEMEASIDALETRMQSLDWVDLEVETALVEEFAQETAALCQAGDALKKLASQSSIQGEDDDAESITSFTVQSDCSSLCSNEDDCSEIESIIAKWLPGSDDDTICCENKKVPKSLKEIERGDFNELFKEYSKRQSSNIDSKKVDREIGRVAGKWFVQSERKRKRKQQCKRKLPAGAVKVKRAPDDRIAELPSANSLFQQYRIKERCSDSAALERFVEGFLEKEDASARKSKSSVWKSLFGTH